MFKNIQLGRDDFIFSYIPFYSGSSGNCTLVETAKIKVLVDVGVSYRRIAESLNVFGVSCDDINRIYITHAHGDHVKGLLGFIKQHNTVVYTREATKRVLLNKYPNLINYSNRINLLNGNKKETIEDLTVHYCRLPHQGKGIGVDDTGEHIGFIFEAYNHRMSFMTDLGHLTENMKKFHCKNDVYFIEANYDDEMQLKSNRPAFLKKRIIGKRGHLSNSQTADYLYELTDAAKTKHVFLAHLSKDCNNSELAIKAVKKRLSVHPVGEKLEIYTDILKRYVIKDY